MPATSSAPGSIPQSVTPPRRRRPPSNAAITAATTAAVQAVAPAVSVGAGATPGTVPASNNTERTQPSLSATPALTALTALASGQPLADGSPLSRLLAQTASAYAQGMQPPGPTPAQRLAKRTVGSLAGLGPDAAALAKADIRYGTKFGIPPSVLFNQQGIESGWGGNTGPSTAGAMGDSQFMPGTRDSVLATYGQSADAYGSPKQSAKAQALLLRDAGYADNPNAAVYSYNHSDAYVNDVLSGANQYSALDQVKPQAVGATGQPMDPQPTTRYVDPVPNASQSRTDQGVDFYGDNAAIDAIGKAKVLSTSNYFAPDFGGPDQGVLYQLLKGPRAGTDVYNYEQLTPNVQAGDIVHKGEQIATIDPGGSIEIGFADPSGAPLAQARGDAIDPSSHYSRAGQQFENFLNNIRGNDPIGPGNTATGAVAPTGSALSALIATPSGAPVAGTAAVAPLQKPRARPLIPTSPISTPLAAHAVLPEGFGGTADTASADTLSALQALLAGDTGAQDNTQLGSLLSALIPQRRR